MTPLRQRMLEDLTMRNLSTNTQIAYITAVAKLAEHFHTSPDQLDAEQVRSYLLHLIQTKKVATATYVQVLCALRFFFYVTLGKPEILESVPCPKTEGKLPVVLSPEEVAQFFAVIQRLKHKALFQTIYAAGLRCSEAIALQTDDIDSKRMLLRIRQGKGRKDRYVNLSTRLLELLRQYWHAHRPVSWLFPGQPQTRHLNRQTVTTLCKSIGRRAALTKVVTPHVLRSVLT